MQWLDNHRVGKYRYLYECKICKKRRIYNKRSEKIQTLDGAMSAIYKQIVQDNKTRKLEITLTEQNLMDLWTKQNGKCYYTGYSMSFESVVHKQEKMSIRTKHQISCDRLDNDR